MDASKQEENSPSRQETEKHQVMTVLGPIQVKDEVTDCRFMMHEHIICSPNKHHFPPSSTASNRNQVPIKLENLSVIRSDPFGNLDNMNLASENEAFEEMQHLKNFQGSSNIAILDMTTAANGRDHKACQRLSRRLGIHILVGTTCCESNKVTSDDDDSDHQVEAFQRNLEHMERELKFGIGTKSEDDYTNLTSINNNNIVRASFLGPISISQDFAAHEQNQLKAFSAVQGTTNAPLIIEAASLEMLPWLLDFIQKSGGLINKTVIAHADLLFHRSLRNGKKQADAMNILQAEVLEKGAFISCDQYAVSGWAYFDFDQIFPTITTVVNMISALYRANPSYLTQIVLGCGIFMKLQFRKYGGVGFPILLQELIPRLKVQAGLSSEEIEAMLNHNPLRLLRWWCPPPIPEKPKTYLTCSICKDQFEPILGEYFTKYTFVYCGTKCLRKHGKMGFKALN